MEATQVRICRTTAGIKEIESAKVRKTNNKRLNAQSVGSGLGKIVCRNDPLRRGQEEQKQEEREHEKQEHVDGQQQEKQKEKELE